MGLSPFMRSCFRRPYRTRLVTNVVLQALKRLPTLKRPYGTEADGKRGCAGVEPDRDCIHT
ncbi:MAG: hypothetical protein BWY63_03397 [Chloroflexi bacterium ADurb.Bin360]|nr:MAG: hypothetical protein BWY63_03397 [Chloroflexi bacterium ADurb.Bin360]